jgi:uncharacterized protein (DUF1778 family)
MSEAKKFDQFKYQNEFKKTKYDRIEIIVPKGEKALIKEMATAAGQSVNEFICSALNDKMASIKGEKDMKNTIILRKGFARLTEHEFKKFVKGDTILGIDRNPEEVKRWPIDQEADAKAELEKHQCKYDGDGWNIEEWALEYCVCDEDGDFVSGSDYEFAEEA